MVISKKTYDFASILNDKQGVIIKIGPRLRGDDDGGSGAPRNDNFIFLSFQINNLHRWPIGTFGDENKIWYSEGRGGKS